METIDKDDSPESSKDELKNEKLKASLLRKHKQAEEFWTPLHERHTHWIKFAIGDENAQWDPAVLRKRNGRTAKQYPIIKAQGNQIKNPIAGAPPEITTYPGNGANKTGAARVNGLLRSIQQESQAPRIYLGALDGEIFGGLGAWRVCVGPDDAHPTEWKAFMEDLDPTTVFWDPASRRPNYSDARYVRIKNRIPAGDLRETYEDADFGEYEDADIVTVWEHWEKKMKDGRVDSIVRYTHLESGQILEIDRSYRCKILPIITITAPYLSIDGKLSIFPLSRDLESTQQQINWLFSEAIAQVAGAAKSMWLAEDGAIDAGDVPRYAASATDPDAILYYKNGHQKPEQILPPPFPTGYMEMVRESLSFARDVSGIYPNQGQNTQAGMEQASGEALKHQRAMTNIAAMHFIAPLVYGLEWTGKILIEICVAYLNTDRVRVSIGADGQPTLVSFGPTQIEGVENVDLSQGEYGVTVTTGATYANQKEELIERLFELTSRNPQIQTLLADWLVAQWPLPGTEEVVDRLRTLLPEDVQQMLASKDSSDPSEQASQLRLKAHMGQMENAKLKEVLGAITEKFQQLSAEYDRLKASKELDAQTRLQVAQMSQETTLTKTDKDNEAKLSLEILQQNEIEERAEVRHGQEIADIPLDALFASRQH